MRKAWVTTACLWFCLLCAPAQAHGFFDASNPEEGSTGPSPQEVTIDFSEDPAGQSDFTVVDGCGRSVGSEATVEGQVVTIPVQGGEPGRWRVSFRVISALDGHVTKGGFGFRVEGEKDCSPATPSEGSPSPIISSPGPPEEDEGGAPFPLLPVAIGVGTVLAAAVAVRAMTGGP